MTRARQRTHTSVSRNARQFIAAAEAAGFYATVGKTQISFASPDANFTLQRARLRTNEGLSEAFSTTKRYGIHPQNQNGHESTTHSNQGAPQTEQW